MKYSVESSRRTPSGEPQKASAFSIIEFNMRPISARPESSCAASPAEMYPQSSASLTQCCVSNCSASASVNLLTKCRS